MLTLGNEILIINELDSGATSTVYLVKSIKNEEIFAAKVYNEPSKSYLNEIEILKRLSSLNCPNIIKLISYGEEYIINNGIPEKEKKQYILIDYLPNKDLFFYVSHLKEMNESNIKSIFYKIVKAVEQCHNKGVCHRDLKLENIMFDANNEPVLCDFRLSGLIETNNGKLTEFVGTKSYAAPEILRQEPYSGIKCDIFSLGVILFTLMIHKFGFAKASSSDDFYYLIKKKKFNQYWDEIGKKIGKEKVNNISKEFKELYFKMVAYSPNDRPSIKEILNNKWLNNI